MICRGVRNLVNRQEASTLDSLRGIITCVNKACIIDCYMCQRLWLPKPGVPGCMTAGKTTNDSSVSERLDDVSTKEGGETEKEKKRKNKQKIIGKDKVK